MVVSTEKYSGVKFKVVFLSNYVPKLKKIDELIEWCKIFDNTGLAPRYGKRSSGNLSFRVKEGFVITAAGKCFDDIDYEDFVMVRKCDIDTKTIYVLGKKRPSSETFMHHLIYNKREDVNAVFHGHDELVLEKSETLGLPITMKELPYGTLELAKEVERCLDKNNYIVIRNHGFVSLGRSMKEAGELAISVHHKSLKLNLHL